MALAGSSAQSISSVTAEQNTGRTPDGSGTRQKMGGDLGGGGHWIVVTAITTIPTGHRGGFPLRSAVERIGEWSW